jgi:small subunit ribosomal protein S18
MLIKSLLLKNFNSKTLLNNNSKYLIRQFSSKIAENITEPFIKSSGISKAGTTQEKKIGQSEKFKIKYMSKEDQEKRTNLLKREITDNPEFFNAFPHLKEVIKREEMLNPEEDLTHHLSSNYQIKEEDQNSEIQEKKENFFESLLHKHKGYENMLKTKGQLEINNKKIFVEGYQDPKGPIKFMSKKEKETIHLEIDRRFQELENSGLSREEILYDKPEGTPLNQDKFFQYIKKNKIAREMLIKPTETFSADLVIEKVLKQDIGPDGSLALKRKNMKVVEDMPFSYEVRKYKEIFNPRSKDNPVQEDDYDYKTNYIDKLKLQLNNDRSRPISFVNQPKSRSELRKKFIIRTIKKKDVTWKNLPLLVRFINDGGKLMNKYQTRLPSSIHRKLAKTVKHARNMGLLPFIDFVKPYHKVPFTSMYNEFLEDTSKVVDKETGIIKVIHLPSDKDKYNYSSYDSAVEANQRSIQV